MPRTTTTSKRSHVCIICQKAFTTSGHLQRHSKVHTGEKKHKCPFPGCQTSCSRQDNLQQHYRIHLSPGSRRSPSTLLTKHPAATVSNRGSSAQILPLTPPSHPSSLSEHIPFTVVDGPPVVRLPADGSTTMTLPSPPNTPPPLVPASPRVALQHQLREQAFDRRHSTGTVCLDRDSSTWCNDESLHPVRPSSCSSSSSSSSSGVPLYDPFSGMISHDDRECETAFPRQLWSMSDAECSHEQIIMDTSDLYVSTTPASYVKDSSFSFGDESASTDHYFNYTSSGVSPSTFQPYLIQPSQAMDYSMSVYPPSAKTRDVFPVEHMVTSQSHDNENFLMNDRRGPYAKFLQPPSSYSSSYPNQFMQSHPLPHNAQVDHLTYNSNASNPQILHNAGSNLDNRSWELW